MKLASAARAEPACLLDANVLVALADTAHVHHSAAVKWFASTDEPFASCPMTQGTLLRMLLQLEAVSTVADALAFLEKFTSHARHRFWPDVLSYLDVSWKGVLGQRQITDAYLASLARHNKGRMVTFDKALAALHADIAVLIPA